MKWVKATERLPELPGKYYVRDLRFDKKTIRWFGKSNERESIFTKQAENIEWLDESEDKESGIVQGLPVTFGVDLNKDQYSAGVMVVYSLKDGVTMQCRGLSKEEAASILLKLAGKIV